MDSSRSSQPFATSDQYSRLRASLLNQGNFGPSGTAPGTITIRAGASTISGVTLAGCDVLIVSHMTSAPTKEELTALSSAVDAGMVVIADADSVGGTAVDAVDAILTALDGSGMTGASACPGTSTGGTLSTENNPATNGPFGDIRGGSFGTTPSSTVVPETGDQTVVTCSGAPVRMVIPPGNLNPGSGLVLAGGDPSAIDLFTAPGGGAFNANNEKLYLNAIASVDVTPPAVTLTAPANGSRVNDATPLFAGAAGAAAGDSATVAVDVFAGTTASGNPVQILTATRSGTAWSASPGTPLAEGTYTARASQTDEAGNIGQSGQSTFTVDVTPPAVTLTSPSNGSSVSDATPTFSGAAGDAAGDSSAVTVDVFTGLTPSGSPVQTLTTSRSGAAWSVTSAAPLSSGVYTARASQTDEAGNIGQSGQSTFSVVTQQQPRQPRDPFPPDIPTAESIEQLPDPEPFEEINIEAEAGRVFVRLPGGRGGAARASQAGAPSGFIPLTQAAQVPVNSIVEASRGRVSLESTADARGQRMQRADFFAGRFQIRQPRARNPVTEMVLKGGSFRACPRATKSATGDPRADASQRRGRRVRRVWGSGRGRFRTRGRYSSATVRGTTWLTEDTCNGTLTRVAARPRTNRVVVRDLVRRRSRLLRAGQSYFAARPLRRR